MNHFIYLLLAIVFETGATSLLKMAEGFTRPLPTVASLACFIAWNLVIDKLGNVSSTNYVLQADARLGSHRWSHPDHRRRRGAEPLLKDDRPLIPHIKVYHLKPFIEMPSVAGSFLVFFVFRFLIYPLRR